MTIAEFRLTGYRLRSICGNRRLTADFGKSSVLQIQIRLQAGQPPVQIIDQIVGANGLLFRDFDQAVAGHRRNVGVFDADRAVVFDNAAPLDVRFPGQVDCPAIEVEGTDSAVRLVDQLEMRRLFRKSKNQ